MKYVVSLRNYVFIWFSVTPSLFISKMNEERLQAFLEENEGVKVLFVTCSDLLNEQAKADLATFCALHSNLVALDIPLYDQDKVATYLNSFSEAVDRKLLEYALWELRAIPQSRGNPAIASDIMRVLYLQHYIYSDFDSIPNLKQVKQWEISVNGTFYFPIIHAKANNDFLICARLESSETNPDWERINKRILENLRAIKKGLLSNLEDPIGRIVRTFEIVKNHPQRRLLLANDPRVSTFFTLLCEPAALRQLISTDSRSFLLTDLINALCEFVNENKREASRANLFTYLVPHYSGAMVYALWLLHSLKPSTINEYEPLLLAFENAFQRITTGAISDLSWLPAAMESQKNCAKSTVENRMSESKFGFFDENSPSDNDKDAHEKPSPIFSTGR